MLRLSRDVQSFRHVLGTPRVPTTMLLMFFARVPMTAMGITLTLHVVSDLGRGYGAAGLVGTMTMAGSALGAPLLGRLIDRHGLRPVVAGCAVVSCAYWVSTPHLPYLALLVAAFPAGMLAVPAGSIARQILTALVPPERRRAAFSMDTISVETSFMIGPAAGIALATQLSSDLALTSIGMAFALVGIALYTMNPPIRATNEVQATTGVRPPIRSWLSARLIATLLIACGALFVLIGTELAALAALRDSGEVGWTGLVIAVMCAASLVGGVIHGAVRRSLSQLTLMILLAVLVLPVGLFEGSWWLLALALIPTNLACAPTLAATTESVSSLAPAAVRGEAMGMQDSATRLGIAIGNPVVGFVIDHSSPAMGFVASGLGGLALAACGVLLQRGAAAGKPAALASAVRE
ncbi:putative MFS family arabinose efflux permease [Amycolatopsis cihanbeyliensis]|uniref:Putative MFS family arabinose efflux permease n=2 Tax=Amycolatopsis cihanbeyliensis TaxID=1128664 RepID=A0A542DMT8_AMYCI|nr:putative MFS family arabinose efflux permease [Amycolatopsis cihanbeyliensis]